MDRRQWLLIAERERGRRLLRRLTGGIAGAAVALTAVIGVALARHDRAAASTTVGTYDPGDQATDPGDQTTDPAQPSTGPVITPPEQPPVPGGGGGGGQHVHSGGS